MADVNVADNAVDFQSVVYQLQELESYLNGVEQQLVEINNAISFVKEISSLNGGEGFVSLTSGIFVPARIEKVDKFLVNVGEKVLVEKTPEETLELLEEQKNTLLSYQQGLLEAFSQLYNKYLSFYQGGDS